MRDFIFFFFFFSSRRRHTRSDRDWSSDVCSSDLGQVTFAGARRTKKQCVFAAANKVSRGQVEHQAAIHLLVKVEIKVVERRMLVAKAGLLAAALEQPVTASSQLIGDQTGKQIDRRHGFDL